MPGRWGRPRTARSRTRSAWSPCPRAAPDGKNTGALGGWQLAVSKYSENPDIAADLVRYLTVRGRAEAPGDQGLLQPDDRVALQGPGGAGGGAVLRLALRDVHERGGAAVEGDRAPSTTRSAPSSSTPCTKCWAAGSKPDVALAALRRSSTGCRAAASGKRKSSRAPGLRARRGSASILRVGEDGHGDADEPCSRGNSDGCRARVATDP